MLLLADGRLDNSCVVSVGNEGDDKVNLGHLSIESFGVVDVELEMSVKNRMTVE